MFQAPHWIAVWRSRFKAATWSLADAGRKGCGRLLDDHVKTFFGESGEMCAFLIFLLIAICRKGV